MFNQAELRKRPTYNELLQEIDEDVRIVLPDTRAKFFRESPYLTYLDNEIYLEVEDQQKQTGKRSVQQKKTMRPSSYRHIEIRSVCGRYSARHKRQIF